MNEVAVATAQKPKKHKKDIRRVKGVSPMAAITPFIMVNRIGAMNLMQDRISITRLEEYIHEKQDQGMPNLSMMHVIIAAYIRLISCRPQLNRFIRGQRVWTRRSIEISLTIKKEMSLESPDTVVKIVLQPEADINELYAQLNKVITDYRNDPGGDFDNTAGALSRIPSLLLKNAIWFLKTLDYFGLIPKFLTGVSPFHCSMFITSMGSLGIPPIYHHLYDFGTCPLFIAFGAKKREYRLNPDGTMYKEQYIDLNFACDERICDGFYYASALKKLKSILRDPWQLDNPPEKVTEDID